MTVYSANAPFMILGIAALCPVRVNPIYGVWSVVEMPMVDLWAIHLSVHEPVCGTRAQ